MIGFLHIFSTLIIEAQRVTCQPSRAEIEDQLCSTGSTVLTAICSRCRMNTGRIAAVLYQGQRTNDSLATQSCLAAVL
jgi:hypothetical protein